MRSSLSQIESFTFQPGKVLARKYEVVSRLGAGWEGEVYMIRERGTKIERAAKFFFPHRNVAQKTSNRSARKLHKLRECPILIHYHTRETIRFRGHDVAMLISDYVDGELLSDFLSRQPGKRLHHFQALHLLHSLALGIECIHSHRDYHGDIHSENVIIRRVGLGFDLRLFDLFHWGAASTENMQDDIVDMIKLFYQAIGGSRHYAGQPEEVKQVCLGLKRSLIVQKFRTATRLRKYLETISWG